MIANILCVVYGALSLTSVFLSFLYWYAYYKTDDNKIMKGAALLMSALSVDTTFFFIAILNRGWLDNESLIFIPKIILLLGILNMIRVSFYDG